MAQKNGLGWFYVFFDQRTGLDRIFFVLGQMCYLVANQIYICDKKINLNLEYIFFVTQAADWSFFASI